MLNMNNTGKNYWKINGKLKINSFMNRNNLSKLKIRNKILSSNNDLNKIIKQLKKSESLGLINNKKRLSPQKDLIFQINN